MSAEHDIAMLREKAGMGEPLTVLEPAEKVMMGEAPSGGPRSRPEGAGSGKPHYTRLMVYDDRTVLAVGCCKPLTVLQTCIDDRAVDGDIILSSHSEERGGKLLYELKPNGNRLVVDLRRGESARFQRLAFEISNLRSGI